MFRKKRLPSLEIHIPISPNPLFFNMAHYLTRSLRLNGGAYRGARVVLTIGDPTIDPEKVKAEPWIKKLGVETRWVPESLFGEYSFFATALERFKGPFQSDVVLMLDADILIVGTFEELIRKSFDENVFCGRIAWLPPVERFEDWQKIYDRAGLGKVEAKHELSGWGGLFSDESLRYSPPYFNLGVLCAPAPLMAQIGAQIYEQLGHVNAEVESVFRCQMALTLALVQARIDYDCLPVRYNFPNHPDIERMSLAELGDVRILHFLADRQGLFKNTVFDDLAHVGEMIERKDLIGSMEVARKVLEKVHRKALAERRR